MDVVWGLEEGGGRGITIVQQSGGPAWPLIGPLVANSYRPVFIHGIAFPHAEGIKHCAGALREVRE